MTIFIVAALQEPWQSKPIPKVMVLAIIFLYFGVFWFNIYPKESDRNRGGWLYRLNNLGEGLVESCLGCIGAIIKILFILGLIALVLFSIVKAVKYAWYF